jgi:hypothetical protein
MKLGTCDWWEVGLLTKLVAPPKRGLNSLSYLSITFVSLSTRLLSALL